MLEKLDVNAKNNDGWTALMFAAAKGRAEIAHWLIDAGADVTAKAKSGVTALSLAEEEGHNKVVRILKDAGAKK